MDIQAITIDSEDDIISVCDRLDWASEQQVVLVLPEDSELFTQFLNLALLRRHADALRMEVGLVTLDSRVKSQAKELGFPTFPSIKSSAESKRRWWRGRRRHSLVGRPNRLSDEDRQEVKRRKAPRLNWQRWSLRYVAVILYILTLTALFIAAVYAFPGATVTLRPEVQPILVKRQIVADPELETVSASGASVPGRVLTSVQEWQAEVEPTGFTEVPDAPARGTAVFVNLLEQPATVPTGTRVRTSGATRVVFQTVEPLTMPGFVGGTAEAEIVAIEPGTEGNVGASLINRIQGPLSLQLEVRNVEPTGGGTVRLEQAVTDADQERIRSQVMQHLQVRALVDMQDKLISQEFVARDSLRVVDTFHETYSHFPGEKTDRLTLEIRAALQATAVDESQAVEMIYEQMVNALPSGYELVPETLRFSSGEVIGTDGQGRVTFEMIGEGKTAASLSYDKLLEEVSGQEIGLAKTYLYERLPLRDYPTISVWPSWFGRTPYLPVRIQTVIEAED